MALLAVTVALWAGITAIVSADQVELQNGDRYYGTVLSLNADNLVLQSQVLGTVRLARSNVAHITLGALPAIKPLVAATNNPGAIAAAGTNTNRSPDLAAMRSQLSANSNLLQQVEAQFLAGADPEAKNKFNELLGGFLSGKLSVNDIRAQAQSTSEQIRAMRKDLGEDAGPALDGYLAILDHFLNETAPATGSTTNSPRPATKPTPAR